MSEEMTETTEAEAPEKKGGKKFLIIIILAVVLLGGGGAGAYFLLFAPKADAEGEEKASKKSKAKAAKEEEEEEPVEKSEKSNSLKGSIPKDEDVKEIVELQPFIVNLADEGEARYLRLSVSLGIGGGEGGHEKPSPLLITRVRNAMLAVLSEKKSDDVLTNSGKAKLRKELLKAAKTAAEDAHIEAIYITDFIVQL